MTPITEEVRRERFEKLAALFDEWPERYNQSSWLDPAEEGCGSVGCIAGWAGVLFGGLRLRPTGGLDFFQARPMGARTWLVYSAGLLGLTLSQAAELFDSQWEPEGSLAEAMRAIGEDPASIRDNGWDGGMTFLEMVGFDGADLDTVVPEMTLEEVLHFESRLLADAWYG